MIVIDIWAGEQFRLMRPSRYSMPNSSDVLWQMVERNTSDRPIGRDSRSWTVVIEPVVSPGMRARVAPNAEVKYVDNEREIP